MVEETGKVLKRSPALPILNEPVNKISRLHEPVETLSWTDKHKPITLRQLIAQQGDKSPMNKLLNWLKNWQSNNLDATVTRKKGARPPWKSGDGSAYKAVILSGPPGIGKTTCAHMACTELKLDFIEMNASDTRNKKQLEHTISQSIRCRQIDRYLTSAKRVEKAAGVEKISHVLVMDEVDGMSGNQDRAGMQELIGIIKKTKIPIICICNDRQSKKIRSLVNYCFDLRFPRPRVEQIRSRLMTIAHLEGIKLNRERIDKVIESSNHDVRQAIYNLQLVGTGTQVNDINQKDVEVNIFEVGRKLLSAEGSIAEKSELFFADYSLMPLFVQENYLKLKSSATRSQLETLDAIQKAADCISISDLIDQLIRSSGSWTLLNEMAMYSGALPSLYMNGHLSSLVQFPSWLGKNSTRSRQNRLLHELVGHVCLSAGSSSLALIFDYIPMFRDRLTVPLIEKANKGVRDVVTFYDAYDLTREDSETIMELSTWPGKLDIMTQIPSKVKSAFTRSFNREKHRLPYSKPSRPIKGTAESDIDD